MADTPARPSSRESPGPNASDEAPNAQIVDQVDIADHLRDLCAALASDAPLADRFDLTQATAGACLVRRDWIAPIGLIVGEAVTNAIRHAHPTGVRGLIAVTCKRGGDGAIVIDVADDGVGLPEGFDPSAQGGHGLGLMRRISARLGAKLRFTSTALGLRVRLRVPGGVEGRAENAADDRPAGLGESLGLLDQTWPRTGGTGGRQPYRDLLNALPTAVYTTDALGRITFYNQAAVELWGVRPKLGDEWCGSWKLYWPDGAPMAHGTCPMAVAIKENRAIRGGEAIAERPDGTRVPFMAYPTPIRDAAGVLVGAVNSLVDISDRKRAEDRQKLLAREIHHRTKNLLAVVYSIVSRGMDGARSAEDTRAVVLGRLRALAATYDNLITTSWVGVELSEIVRTELGPHPAQWSVAGPSLVLNPQAAQNFTLALHELTTNAAKYGALSTPAGAVDVSWSIHEADDASRFSFTWRERGGPAVSPRTHEGFGSVVLERVITQDFKAPPKLVFAPGGLTYALDVALEAVAASAEPGDLTEAVAGPETLDRRVTGLVQPAL